MRGLGGWHCVLGYANFGNNGNFHMLHIAVHQTNDREWITDFFLHLPFFAQYHIRLKILFLRHP